MTSKKALTLNNLVRFGSERLAGILLDLATEEPPVKRRLRLELAGIGAGEIAASEVGKRITILRSTLSLNDRQRHPHLVRDIELTRTTIVSKVGQTRPDLALDLMWHFMLLVEPVINRVGNSAGAAVDVFRTACDDLGTLAVKAETVPQTLAERVYTAITNNRHGEFDNLVSAVFPALGKVGVAALRARLHTAIGPFSSTDRYDGRAVPLRRALQDLADSEGDVDAYIALVPQEYRSRPALAAGIGRRLLAAGRVTEALSAIETARPNNCTLRGDLDDDLYRLGSEDYDVVECEAVCIEALDATGQTEQAQRLRWAAFEKRLSVESLRAYLKRLPDFEDVDAEERAMEYALGFRRFSTALHFFQACRAHRQAARLVLERHAEIDGDLCHLLDPAVRWLEGAHPLAATLLRRAMIHHTLAGAKSKRFRHAARHLAECQSLTAVISDYGQFEPHETYVSRLRDRYDRKTRFWGLLPNLPGNQMTMSLRGGGRGTPRTLAGHAPTDGLKTGNDGCHERGKTTRSPTKRREKQTGLRRVALQ